MNHNYPFLNYNYNLPFECVNYYPFDFPWAFNGTFLERGSMLHFKQKLNIIDPMPTINSYQALRHLKGSLPSKTDLKAQEQPAKTEVTIITCLPSEMGKVQRSTKDEEVSLYSCSDCNIYSNLLRVFLRRLEIRLKKGLGFVQTIIGKNKLRSNVEDFIDWYERNKLNHKNYIRMNTVKRLFRPRIPYEENTTIMRILLQEFLKNEALPCYMTSKKASKDDPKTNYVAMRTIMNSLLSEE